MTPPAETTLEMPGTHGRSRTLALRIALVALAATGAFAAIVTSGDAAGVTHRVAVGAGGDDRMRGPATIAQGDTVDFVWEDGGHDLALAGPESTSVPENDEGFRLKRVFNRPGEYSYLCTLHDNMTGKFTVTPDANAPQNPPPPAVDVVVNSDGDSTIDPNAVTVTTGQPVNWHWGEGGVSITFADGQSSGSRSMGAMWSRTFTTVGTYSYRSSEGRTATVKVIEPSAAGSGISPAPAGSTAAASVNVGGSGNTFSPASVSIDEGQVVRWTWSGGTHNVRFQDGTDSGFKSTGTSDLKFSTPGTFSYVCSAHSGMAGSVTVRDTGTPGPNETPPPSGGNTGGGNTGGGTTPPDEGTTGGTPASADVAVGGTGNTFAPASVSVQTGQYVKWTWAAGNTVPHNVTFDDGVANNDSSTKTSGTFTRRFLNPGTFAYACTLHPEMTGSVTVTGTAVPDDGTGTVGEGGGSDTGNDTGNDTGDDAGNDTGDDSAQQQRQSTSTGDGSGGSMSAAAATAATGAAAGPDQVRPAIEALRVRLTRGRAARKLELSLSEGARLNVTMVALGRSTDMVKIRRFRLAGRQGVNTLRLPVMNLGAKRYRLRIVAVDAAGNRSAPSTMVVRVA